MQEIADLLLWLLPYSFPDQVISELRGDNCHIGLHSVTCHSTQVNTPRSNPSQTGRYSIYLPWRDGRLSRPRRLVTYRDGLPYLPSK